MDMKVGHTQAILAECRKRGLLRNQTAYVLATSWHETAHTMKPIYERGKRAYFDKYEPGTKIGKNLGNTQPGDGYRYRGAGFVQLTGRANFAKAGKKLGIDLLDKPELALDAKVAAQILVVGMVEGWFTGKKLSDYITATKAGFVGARRIINGTDRAQLIAKHAVAYEADLRLFGYDPVKSATQKPASALQSVEAPSPIVTPEIVQVAAPAAVVIDKAVIANAQKRLAELGYNPGGADGIAGPLTKGAVMAFRNDNGLIVKDEIDDEFLLKLQTAKPRSMVPERANATTAQVAGIVPEAKVHWWTRLSAGILGGSVGGVGLLDQITPAVGYLTPVKEFIGDVPPLVWIGGIVLVCGGLYLASQYGANKSADAFRAGDRR